VVVIIFLAIFLPFLGYDARIASSERNKISQKYDYKSYQFIFPSSLSYSRIYILTTDVYSHIIY